MIEYPFRVYQSKVFGRILRPKIQIGIKGSKSEMEILAVLDSGADITMIPFKVGQEIGFELDETKIMEMKGISSSPVPYILTEAVKLR